MPHNILNVPRVSRRIDAMHVIHNPVAIIIDPIAWDLARISPQIGYQIRMRDQHTGVDNGNNEIRWRVEGIPSHRRMNVSTHHTSALSRVI